MKTLRLLVAVLLVAVPLSAEAKSYRAERFDVEVRVARDGSIGVTETVVFRFEGGPFTSVFREVPTAGTDGIVDVVASLDGRVLPAGDGPGRVEVRGAGAGEDGGRRVRVEWHFAPLSDASAQFVLSYRVLGVATPGPPADELRWTVLPRDHDYRIDSSVVSVAWPDDVNPLGPLSVVGARSARPVVEAAAVPRRVEARDIRKDGHFAVALRFPPGTITEGTPRWLARRAQHRAALATYATAAAALAAVIIALFLLLRLRSGAPSGAGAGEGPIASPPGTRPPALAGALRNNGSSGAPHLALATLVDLARQGHLDVEEAAPASRWSSAKFDVVRRGHSAPVHAHERAVLDRIFDGEAAPGTRVPLARAGKALAGHLRDFGAVVGEELRRERLLDEDRQASRRLLTRMAIAGIGVGAAGFLPAALLVSRMGPAPLLIPAAIVLGSLVGLAIGRSITPLSDRGLQEAARWRAFDRTLRAAARSRDGRGPAPSQLLEWVGYATALGAGAAVAKHLKAHGVALPTWLRSASGDHGALMSVMTASHLGGDASGVSGAGGGAAGGGSSGAH
jgi:hypothetical protein